MFQIVLFEPEIPPNTGNIIRLCANSGCELHLIEPLGFTLEEKALRRAGLDYHEWANVHKHESWEAFYSRHSSARIHAFSTHAQKNYCEVRYQPGDFLMFGPETRGLPQHLRNGPAIHDCSRIPMQADSRSLNLSNSVSIIVYEALRQNQFGSLQ